MFGIPTLFQLDIGLGSYSYGWK